MPEPSILDDLKDRLNLFKRAPLIFFADHFKPEHLSRDRISPLLPLVPLALSLMAQYALDLRQRHWLDLFLLLSVPLLMLPSILSLAFPSENPSLSRSGGAIVPVFLIIGIAFEGVLVTLKSHLKTPWKSAFVWGLGVALLACSAFQNYQLVFHQYHRMFLASSWNTSEMGHLIRAFADSVGHADSAWVVGYPHWVDTRLVGINAGVPAKDYAIWPDQFKETLNNPRAKLFLIKPEDTDAVTHLQKLYPQATLRRHASRIETKDFLILFVPPREVGERE